MGICAPTQHKHLYTTLTPELNNPEPPKQIKPINQQTKQNLTSSYTLLSLGYYSMGLFTFALTLPIMVYF